MAQIEYFNPVLIKWRHKLTLQCLKTCPQEIMCCNSTSNSRLSTVLYAHDFQCGVVRWLYPQQLYGPCLARPVVWSNWHTCLQLHSEMELHVQSVRNYCFSGHSHAATVLNEMGQPAMHIAACNHVHPTLSIHL